MARQCDEPVDVRTSGTAGVDGAPAAFIWCERLYLVRAVVGHWHERRAWWRQMRPAAARTELGSGVVAGTDGPGVIAQGAVRASSVPAPRSGGASAAEGAAEPVGREIWRVEAAAGRDCPLGIYDLARDPGHAGVDGMPSVVDDLVDGWRLVWLAD